MQPMDFEEFLWAKGIKQQVIDYLKECFNKKIPISSAVHQSMLRYFKEYICVGGLPDVVATFIESNSMKNVLETQKDLREEYKDDFGKHLDDEENEEVDLLLFARIEEIFPSIPNQLGKEEIPIF